MAFAEAPRERDLGPLEGWQGGLCGWRRASEGRGAGEEVSRLGAQHLVPWRQDFGCNCLRYSHGPCLYVLHRWQVDNELFSRRAEGVEIQVRVGGGG